MKRLPIDACGFAAALNVIGGKWKSLLLWELNIAPRRFGELKRLIPGITEKMLVQQLREMEADGIVHREVFYQLPPKVQYSVTDFGVSLNAGVTVLSEWGKRHQQRMVASEVTGAGGL